MQSRPNYGPRVRYGSAEILSKNLKRWRGTMTQKDFAKKLGIPASQLNRLELGSLNTTLDTLDRISSALKVSPGDLFREK